jgi:hypothetical protein
MATIGPFVQRTYRMPDGLRMYDAIDPDLDDLLVDPRTPPRRSTARSRTGRSRAQTEIIDFLASQFGRYSFSSGGGIVDDADNLFFALENQTRSI